MNKLILLSFMMLPAGMALAQTAREEPVKIVKNAERGLVVVYEAPEAEVEEALKAYFAREGFARPGTSKGVLTYKQVRWAAISPDAMDVYVKVDGNKKKTTVSLVASKGYDNFINSATDAEKTELLKRFLEGFNEELRQYRLRQRIAEQEAAIRKMGDEHRYHTESSERLQRQKEKAEQELAKVEEARKKHEQKLEEARQQLKELQKQLSGKP